MNTDYLQYMSAIVGCYSAMSEKEKQALHEWERKYVDGSGKYGTSDWPGWEKYIGSKPIPTDKEPDKFGYVYLIHSSNNRYKIGITKSINTRLSTLQIGNPEKLDLVHYFPSSNAYQSEKLLHDKYNHKKIRDEWFNLSNTDVQEICNISSGLDIQS